MNKYMWKIFLLFLFLFPYFFISLNISKFIFLFFYRFIIFYGTPMTPYTKLYLYTELNILSDKGRKTCFSEVYMFDMVYD